MGYLRNLALASCLAVLPATGASALTFTGSTGSGQAFTNMQPSLALGQYIQSSQNGYFPTRDGNGASPPGYVGQIRTFGYAAPNFFTNAAQGGVQSIFTDTPLFSILGNQYGGNGVNNFALPNLAGATMVGAGISANGSMAGNYALAAQVGQNNTTMTVAQMPAHDHGLPGILDTGSTGSGQSIDNRQSSLAITYGIVANGGYRYGDGIGFTGEIQSFAGNFVPNGLLAANGQLVSIAQYQALYSLIGTAYGGDGVQFFRLPDLTGRTAVGASQTAAATRLQIAQGQAIGSNTLTLTEANLPSHVHTVPGEGPTEAAGGNQAFSTTQPSLGVNYIINAWAGLYPTRGEQPAGFDYMIGEVTAYAGRADLLPQGWLLADGSILSVAQNQALFSLLGNAFGGNGVSTFALPDLRGRSIVGNGTRDGVNYGIGQVFGQTNVQLGVGNLPAHVHTVPEVAAAVPEPASWAMMIGGVGLVGGAMRRRRPTVRTAVTFA